MRYLKDFKTLFLFNRDPHLPLGKLELFVSLLEKTDRRLQHHLQIETINKHGFKRSKRIKVIKKMRNNLSKEFHYENSCFFPADYRVDGLKIAFHELFSSLLIKLSWRLSCKDAATYKWFFLCSSAPIIFHAQKGLILANQIVC